MSWDQFREIKRRDVHLTRTGHVSLYVLIGHMRQSFSEIFQLQGSGEWASIGLSTPASPWEARLPINAEELHGKAIGLANTIANAPANVHNKYYVVAKLLYSDGSDVNGSEVIFDDVYGNALAIWTTWVFQ